MFEARVEDRLAIQDVIYRWCRAIDRLDIDLVRACYHPDGEAYHGPTPRSPDELIAWIEERQPSITHSMHQAANILIEFTGPDSALVETYMFSNQRFAESAVEYRAALLGEEAAARAGFLDVQSTGRYVDVFERRDGRWAIRKRTVIVEGYWPRVTPDWPRPDPSWPALARRDAGDSLHVERRAAGLV